MRVLTEDAERYARKPAKVANNEIKDVIDGLTWIRKERSRHEDPAQPSVIPVYSTEYTFCEIARGDRAGS